MIEGRPPACVLAGGLSSRMGRDKAMLPFAGTTLLGHALDRLSRAGFSPFLSGARRDAPAHVPCVPDNYETQGPLGGIEAALRAVSAHPEAFGAESPDTPVLFLAVDLPFASVELLRFIYERALLSGALASLPSVNGQPQPLCAVYRASLAPALAQALDQGDRKVIRVLKTAISADRIDEYRYEAVAAAHGFSGAELPFRNINTPADAGLLRI